LFGTGGDTSPEIGSAGASDQLDRTSIAGSEASSPAAIRIRPVDERDHRAVGDLLVSCYDGIDGAQRDPEYNREIRDVQSRMAHADVLVAVDSDDEVVGTITYLPRSGPLSELAGPGEGEFRMFAVAPHSRGKGVGRALVDTCIELAREQHLSRVWLSTSPWMTRARCLYEALGFRRVPSRDHVEVSSGLAFELLAYVLDI
jgi:ribosomal protein S18 acetylase RimI-like enzyme